MCKKARKTRASGALVNPSVKDYKLAQAHYFLKRMREVAEDSEVYGYYLDAFLCSARSIMQIAYEETEGDPQGKTWYDGRAQVPIVKFMKEQRDTAVHRDLIQRVHHRGILVGGNLGAGISAKGGSVEVVGNLSSQAQPEAFTIAHTFGQWLGQETVDELCSLYIDELQDILQDGRSRKFLK